MSKRGHKFRLKAGEKISLDPDSELQIVSTWEEDLMWCPSQCYLSVKHGTSEYQIYLRWRHSDPWACRLIRNGGPGQDDKNSRDLFEMYGKFWSENDKVKSVERSAIECVRKFLRSKAFSTDFE